MKLRHLAIAVLATACGAVPLGTKGEDVGETDTGSGSEVETLSFGGVDISPASVDFGSVAIGGDKEATVTLANTRDTEVLISNAYVSGSDGFTLEGSLDLPLTMGGEASQVLTIGFAPEELSRVHGVLYVGVAGEVGYAEIDLAGKGKEGGADGDDTGEPWEGEASLSVEPSSVDFGTVAVLSSSSQALTLTNTGSQDVRITHLNITDSAFTVGSEFSIPALIEHGSSVSLPLTFAPESEGLYEAILDIDTNPSIASLYVDLTGLGGESECTICAPQLSVSTSSGGSSTLDLLPAFGFGCTASGSVVLTNSGDQTLDINNVTVRNDTISTCGEFSRSWAGATSLEPGASSTIAVDYVAEESCLDFAYVALDQNVMHIRTSDPEQPDAVVGLTGTALLCD